MWRNYCARDKCGRTYIYIYIYICMCVYIYIYIYIYIRRNCKVILGPAGRAWSVRPAGKKMFLMSLTEWFLYKGHAELQHGVIVYAYQKKAWQFDLWVHLKLLLDARLHTNVQIDWIHPKRKYLKLVQEEGRSDTVNSNPPWHPDTYSSSVILCKCHVLVIQSSAEDW